jgi:hypothetical protein
MPSVILQHMHIHQLTFGMPCNRSDQLLEMFEAAPDDQANWGKAISMDQKLYRFVLNFIKFWPPMYLLFSLFLIK